MAAGFSYQGGELHAENVALSSLAQQFGTPAYIYSRAAIEANWQRLDAALGSRPHLICYAVKANSNLAVLNILARLGSGFDIVSVGELERVLAAGGDAGRVVFSGVGKRPDEMQRALTVGIRCFNVESLPELERLNEIAGQMGKQAPIALRVNPDVDAGTHPYIATGLKENKFGIAHDQALLAYERAAELAHIDIVGIACHIGSQITTTAPFHDAAIRVKGLVEQIAARGIQLRHIDCGGGLGVCYRDEQPPAPADWVTALTRGLGNAGHELILEPGRSIVGDAGVLMTRVEYLKQTPDRHFAVVDAAMNDLMRPALYGAWQSIRTVTETPAAATAVYDVVGPVCETGDWLGKERELAITAGDLLAIGAAGAYGFGMSSNYNSRPRACEIMVDADSCHEIRARESLADLFSPESLLPG
ncbi:MAG: diaminopimelate decarboxylase [Gammaproteobacteria bacterium]